MTAVPSILSRPLRGPAWLREMAPLLPAALVVLTLFGLTVDQTPDSTRYLAAAESVRASGAFGRDYLYWPPLYPLLLAMHGSMAAETWAAIIGNLGALASLLGMWALGRKTLQPVTLALTLLAFVSVARFGTVFASAWSEVVFVPIAIWLAFFWSRYLATERGAFAACVLLGLAMLARHVGVVLAVAMALTAIRWRKRRALVGIGLACVPWMLWLWRTYRISGTPTGPRPPIANPDLLQKLDLFGRVWEHWFFPHAYFASGGALVGGFFLAALLAALVAARRSPLLAFATLTAIGHCVLTIYSASRTTLDVDARTLFPILWAALLVGACAVERGITRLQGWRATLAKVALSLYLLTWFSAPNAITNWLVE